MLGALDFSKDLLGAVASSLRSHSLASNNSDTKCWPTIYLLSEIGIVWQLAWSPNAAWHSGCCPFWGSPLVIGVAQTTWQKCEWPTRQLLPAKIWPTCCSEIGYRIKVSPQHVQIFESLLLHVNSSKGLNILSRLWIKRYGA
jgi:hypothetical protein